MSEFFPLLKPDIDILPSRISVQLIFFLIAASLALRIAFFGILSVEFFEFSGLRCRFDMKNIVKKLKIISKPHKRKYFRRRLSPEGAGEIQEI